MSGRIDEIVSALRAKGLADVQAHARFMIVNGSIAPDQLEVLRSVAGVQSVREDATYRAKA
jgi:6,7-dimethyl-8-ribityllumazine synthase